MSELNNGLLSPLLGVSTRGRDRGAADLGLELLLLDLVPWGCVSTTYGMREAANTTTAALPIPAASRLRRELPMAPQDGTTQHCRLRAITAT